MQLLDIPKQTPSSEVDEEILEIFIEEVEEVLQDIITDFKIWKDNPANSESLTNLRRAFHTLKGSGRLVGATVIGELGWRFEDVLKSLLEGTLERTDEILSLIEQVEKVLPSMIAQFKQNQPPPEELVYLISQVNALASS